MARKWAEQLRNKKLRAYARGLAPAIVALAFATTAHAQGTIDFTQAGGFFGTVKTFVLLVGGLILVCSAVFSAARFASGRMAEAAMGFLGVLIGGLIIGLGPGYITSLSGQAVQ